ncbi:MAG: S9 family peptidase [Chitinophagales bacterium]|nr:S9 family peptidase [Chitinophagales bacterium]
MANSQTIPSCEKIPFELKRHNDKRIDNYYWLNEYWTDGPRKQQVVDYLEAENAYSKAVMAPTDALQEELFQEIKGRIKQKDESVPYFENGYWYYTKTEENQEYPIYCRKEGALEAEEEVILDVNKMAEGHEYYKVSGLEISPDNQILAFAVDTLSRRIYTIYFKVLATGEVLSETITNASANFEWANDNKTLFYTSKDVKTLREDKVWSYILGKKESERLIFEEKDDTYYVSLSKTKSKNYILINSESTLSTEVRFVNANQPNAKFEVFLPREKDHLYEIEDYNGDFYILTNWRATNFRIMKTPTHAHTNKRKWKTVVAHRDDVLVENFDIFKDYLVVSEQTNANSKIRVIPWQDTSRAYYIPFDEEVYVASMSYNPEFDTDKIRMSYQSMITPSTIYEYQLNTKTFKILKQQEVLGGYDKNNYETKRLWATVRDGVKVPISIVYKKDFVQDGKQPLLLYGYGSYGISMSPYFRSSVLSLLDRGFAYAVAHIRGGQEMGRPWYEDSKLFKKKNTFYDFIDCAEYLIESSYTSPQHLYANGGSAGGLLMGAIANMRPDLWHGIVSDVPFVDALTTMLDESIPLTTGEYDEWGNPNNKRSYNYIKSYSPYDNIESKDYPNMMINTGLHDSQVQYFEPAKYVAKLRELKTDDNILLFNCDMSTGHGGSSGRFQALRETAREFAFYLMLEGKLK